MCNWVGIKYILLQVCEETIFLNVSCNLKYLSLTFLLHIILCTVCGCHGINLN